MPSVYIPAELRPHTADVAVIEVAAVTVGAAIDAVEGLHPGFREHVCAGARLRPGLMLSINGTLATRGLREPLEPADEVHFLPAIGGG